MTRLAPAIHRLGEGTVNAYLLDDGGEVTIIDAGAPAYWGALPTELAAMGRSLDDVRAVVLTHAHADHLGFAERIRRERGVPVRVHEADASMARGETKPTGQQSGRIRVVPLLAFLWFSVRHGMLRIPPVREVSTFGDGATLDVPGSPTVIALPGHSPGSAALHVPRFDALFIGDALATRAVTSGATGPRIAPFTSDPAQALASLSRLDGIEAGLVLPGHGLPWTGGVAAAVAAVRASEAGPDALGARSTRAADRSPDP
jgi:glyoxylase-like metal-dependent hydrolase (beta-lactamase superfamily II)